MSRLAGKFAGIVLVTVADDRFDPLVADLTALKAQGLHVTLERTDEPVERESQRLHLELLGADHPGIVAEISASLATHHVSIEELSTEVREAPMAGGTLFEARAVLNAPPTTSTDALRSMLEGLAHELMVEIRLSDDREASSVRRFGRCAGQTPSGASS
jgi:glycine cleavage system regulatory protein